MTGKRILGIGMAFILAVANAAGVSAESETDALEENQRKALIYVVSITGNELTYYEEETEAETESETGTDTEGESGTGAESESGGGAGVETEDETGTGAESETATGAGADTGAEAEAASGAETENTPADSGSEQSGGGGNGDPGQMNGDFDPSQMANGDFDPSQMTSGDFDPTQMGDGSFDGNQIEAGAETTTVYLPVAVTVHTGNGETRTFSILEAGDELEVLFEENEDGEEIITEIWLKSTGGDT